MQGYIFDLDGVIVNTAKYHFKAWRVLSKELDLELTLDMNEHLKGISREDSLRKILGWSNREVSSEVFYQMAHRKNELYLHYISRLSPSDVLPGVLPYFEFLSKNGKKIALGSASKNARYIVRKLNLEHFFEVIIDGNQVCKAKPDPQVFVLAAQQMDIPPSRCVVFEDSHTGIQAAQSAGMKAVAIGSSPLLSGADAIFPDFCSIQSMEQFLHSFE